MSGSDGDAELCAVRESPTSSLETPAGEYVGIAMQRHG